MKFEKRIHFYSPCGNDYISTQELYALGKIIRTDAGVEYLTPCCMVSDNPGQSGMLLFISKIDALVYAKNRLIEEDEELNLYDFKDINVTELMMNMPIFEGGVVANIVFGYSVDVYERIRMPEGRLALSYFAIPFRVTEKLSVMSPVTLKFNQEVFDAANEYWEFLFDDYCSTVTQQNKLSEIDLEEAATNALNEIRKNNTTIISIDAVSMAAPESVSHYSISHGKWVVSNLKTHSVN